jgi:3D (Asp-Asp-Asp) domain-containing protein
MRLAAVLAGASIALVSSAGPARAEDRAPRSAAAHTRKPAPTRFRATAYCQAGKTQSGVPTRTGIVAADPRVLRVGAVIRILEGPVRGVYSVMDTGALVKGRTIDIFMPSCSRARQFGRRTVAVQVIGWRSPRDDRAARTSESFP